MRSLLVFVAMSSALFADSLPGAWVETGAISKDGVHDSPEIAVPQPFTRAVLSWNADLPSSKVGPDGNIRISCAQFELQAGTATGWLPWRTMGTWEPGNQGASVKSPADASCEVDVDTLVIGKGLAANRFRYRVRLTGGATVRLIAVATWTPGDAAPFAAEKSAAWGRTIDVPRRSQMVEDASIRGDICSPTSLAMVMEHFAVIRTTREAADGVYDHEAKIYGNWPLNTAYAAVAGREIDVRIKLAYVARFRSLEELETEIAAGRPVIISHKWKEGELTGAPVAKSNGHLIVVVGFTETGDVVVNDPAAHPDRGEDVRRAYPRREIYHTWLENASGIAYIVRSE